MTEEAYPKDHPAHPDNAGKKFVSPGTPISHDYPANHPARGGQGQGVPIAAGGNEPRDGHKHLHGLSGNTLAEKLAAFAHLSEEEKAERLEWNEKGIPATAEEE